MKKLSEILTSASLDEKRFAILSIRKQAILDAIEIYEGIKVVEYDKPMDFSGMTGNQIFMIGQINALARLRIAFSNLKRKEGIDEKTE